MYFLFHGHIRSVLILRSSLDRNGAALSSGLIHEGDELLAIDGESTSGLSVSEVIGPDLIHLHNFSYCASGAR